MIHCPHHTATMPRHIMQCHIISQHAPESQQTVRHAMVHHGMQRTLCHMSSADHQLDERDNKGNDQQLNMFSILLNPLPPTDLTIHGYVLLCCVMFCYLCPATPPNPTSQASGAGPRLRSQAPGPRSKPCGFSYLLSSKVTSWCLGKFKHKIKKTNFFIHILYEYLKYIKIL